MSPGHFQTGSRIALRPGIELGTTLMRPTVAFLLHSGVT